MLKQEEIKVGKATLLHTYSDTYTIIQFDPKTEIETEYQEAYDKIPCSYTYRESENLLPKAETEEKGVVENAD